MDIDQKIRNLYDEKKSAYDDLLREAEFILNLALKKSGVKIHNITYRVKDFDSLVKKCEDKQIEDPFEKVKDIAGLRIVCLFRSDLDTIENVIKTSFELLEKDDKVNRADGFGYISVHYICSMRHNYSGPRYDYLRGLVLEIQTRTLCMDAWAAVSHHLSYKGDWDVPDDLKRAMNALSGLFYVADNEFLQAYRESAKSKLDAVNLIETRPKEEIPINFDTIQAYVAKRFPNRLPPTDDRLSKIVHQLSESGYKNIEEIDEDVNNTMSLFEDYENELKKLGKINTSFQSLGALRVALAIANKRMEQLRSDGSSDRDYDAIMYPYREKYIVAHKDRSSAQT